jgi:ribosome-binding protein aMBF1 (putative translation factor)
MSRAHDHRTDAPRRESRQSESRERGEPPLHVALGKAVRRLREERGISQEELGYRSRLHRNHVGNIERGDSMPTLHSVEALATGLEIRASELIALSEQA